MFTVFTININTEIKRKQFTSKRAQIQMVIFYQIFKITFIVGTALAMIKYRAQLFFNRAKLVQLFCIGNAGKLRYLPFITSVF